MAKTLFIGEKILKEFTVLDGNLDPSKVVQYIDIAQDIHIQNYLGTKLYNRLKSGVQLDNLNANETELLTDYVQRALVFWTASEYLPFSPYAVSNGGAHKHTAENSLNADISEVEKLAAKYKDYAEYYTQRMIDYLCENSGNFPEYDQADNDDVKADKDLNDSSAWYLGESIE